MTQFFFSLLKGLLKQYGYKATNADEVLNYIFTKVGAPYKPFFDQYLRYATPPELLITKQKKKKGTEVTMQWRTNVTGFVMNVELQAGNEKKIFTVSSDNPTKSFVDTKPKLIKVLNDRYYFKFATED